MDSTKTNSIRILIAHDTQNDAEPIISALRNSGQAVRSLFVASVTELAKVIEDEVWDLFLVKLNTTTIDASIAIDNIRRSGKDIPMVGLIDQYDSEIIASSLSMGMTDTVIETQLPHLILVVKREVENLKTRRELRIQRVISRETEKRCQLLLESSMDAISYVHEGMHIYANPNYIELFGYDDLEEMQCTPIIDLISARDIDRFKDTLKLNEEESTEFTTEAIHKSGSVLQVSISLSSASYEGEPCVQVVIRTVSTDTAMIDKLKQLTTKDLTTGLYNRTYFNEQIEKAYQQVITSSKRQIVVHLGISNFSAIKTQTGLSNFDVVLKQMADILNNTLQDKVTIAFYSDDMFSILFNHASLEEVKTQISLLHENILDQIFEVNNKTVQVEVAFGIAHIDESCKTGNEALVQANQAYTKAVANQLTYSYFDKSDIDNLTDNSLLAKVEHAIIHDHLFLQFQPILNLRSNHKESYVVLIRLKDKDRGNILPEEFLPVIENSDLAAKLDRWVVEKSLDILNEHQQNGHNSNIMIHLTHASIQDPTFLPWVNSQLKDKNISGQSICFQITEQCAQTYLKTTKAFSKGLRLLNCQLAIHRFGTSEQSLNLMRHLSIDYVCIDGLFVEQLIEDGETSEKLVELLRVVHENKIASIVPKIENAEVLSVLWELGVHYIQGYYLQAPLDSMTYNFETEE